MKIKSLVVAAAAVLAAVGASYAAPITGAATQQEKALVKARDQVSAQASLTKGAAQQSYELERRRLDQLIDQLQAGRPVPASEVNRALGDASRAP